MNYVQGSNRLQMTVSSLEDQIEADNPVRFIDAFVEKLDLSQLGYQEVVLKEEGRPPFHPKLFLKIYLYGYLNGIRSSRKLDRECFRNLELQWLTGYLFPNYHTIADFRKVNNRALRNTFKLFVLFLKEADLVSGKHVAVDGTKVRAHNSKKNNYNPKKIERHLLYIEEKTNEYLAALDENDKGEVSVNDIHAKLKRLAENKIRYEALAEQLEQSGEPQISTTDADARALLVQGQVVEVCYNMQAAVDEKHKLIVATHTINRNDRNALYDIALEAKINLSEEDLLVTSDKGYHNARQLQQCKDAGITTICAQQELVNSNDHGTTPAYLITQFKYNKRTDTYRCPQGSILRTQGTWHVKARDYTPYRFKKYRTPDCKDCPAKHLCTGRAKGGREIERSEFAGVVEENAKRYRKNYATYRKRQELNEHVFGTIKRKWGYYYTNLKGREKVNGEHSLICLVYNIKRTINILGFDELMKKLKKWQPNYKRAAILSSKQGDFKPFTAQFIFALELAA
ncbi:MAG: IS1182 family transposase [Chitinophagales bacterium]